MTFINDDAMKTSGCGCSKCWDEWAKKQEGFVFRHFIVCSVCGNKRCPKATDHELDCTGSNNPGQKGSRYE
jgi:hypothetical protein